MPVGITSMLSLRPHAALVLTEMARILSKGLSGLSNRFRAVKNIVLIVFEKQ